MSGEAAVLLLLPESVESTRWSICARRRNCGQPAFPGTPAAQRQHTAVPQTTPIASRTGAADGGACRTHERPSTHSQRRTRAKGVVMASTMLRHQAASGAFTTCAGHTAMKRWHYPRGSIGLHSPSARPALGRAAHSLPTTAADSRQSEPPGKQSDPPGPSATRRAALAQQLAAAAAAAAGLSAQARPAEAAATASACGMPAIAAIQVDYDQFASSYDQLDDGSLSRALGFQDLRWAARVPCLARCPGMLAVPRGDGCAQGCCLCPGMLLGNRWC